MNTNIKTFIVMVLGYWGRGKTVKEAAEQCKKMGARNSDVAIIRCIVGDEKPYVDDMGYINYNQDTLFIDMGNGYKLGHLLKLKD